MVNFNWLGNAVGRASASGQRAVGAGARGGKKTMRKRKLPSIKPPKMRSL